MPKPNPYEPPTSQQGSTVPASDVSPYSCPRGIAIYVAACFFLWFFVAPMVAPTDVAPKGAPPIPPYLIAIQMVLCYGGPAVLVFLDWRRHRKVATIDTHTR